MLFMWRLETWFPNYDLPKKEGWFLRATCFNVVQLFVTMLGHYTWEHWIMGGKTVFHLSDHYSPLVGGLIAYFAVTWVFYWWHRLRHENKLVWLIFHQFHHSPERIEVITALYKHPLEIIANSIIITTLVYPILGLSVEANTWVSVFSAFGEFFYHMNIKTPYWLGYFIQRPESHCLHHLRNLRDRCPNHSDFPLWDILGGTFKNPTENCLTGFSENKEEEVKDMLLFRDVVKPRKKVSFIRVAAIMFLVILGSLSTFAYIKDDDLIRGAAFSTAASPLPLVFTAYNNVETFSLSFDVNFVTKNDSQLHVTMDKEMYNKIQGPYNRRNIFGATLCYGPFFDKPNMIQMRQQILHWGVCQPGNLIKEFGITDEIKEATFLVRSKTKGNKGKHWKMHVNC